MKKINTVEAYILNHENWKDGLILLREIILGSGLEETIKWGAPAYTWKGKNVIGLGAFKNHLAIWFFQGALLRDTQKKLVNAQEGTTRALRQWRFTSAGEISGQAELIAQYVTEALRNAKENKKVRPAKKKPVKIPAELQKHLYASTELNDTFSRLSEACKREYAEYISGAKRPETRERRMDKIIPMILEKKGLNDKYK